MATTLHPKIKELKAKAAPINYRSISVNQFGQIKTDTEDYKKNLALGIIEGYGCTWQTNSRKELFMKGAWTKSINERGPGTNGMYEIKMLNQHDQKDPMCLFEYLREDDYGLRFKTLPVDDVPTVQRRLKQIISGTISNYSVGFQYVWDKMEYDEKNDLIIMKEGELYEISAVSIPVDLGTYTVRSIEDLEDLNDEVDEFIDSLPRKLRLEARQLFARHKALADLNEPLKTRSQTLKQDEPPSEDQGARKINYNFLIQNL